ncbi:MAG: efflux RND transporter periplasmic adaptor subunit [Kiritimatiellaeota bacterium]|nr:efflux RND transporter periplasmic adaptor subunit [Kiritimatiellota bacterium]
MKRIVLLMLISGTVVLAQVDDDHAGHDHAMPAEEAGHEEHESLEVEVAEGGLVSRMASFPAEIQMNRDRAAAVSPKYAGTVRELHAQIGDTVKAGDLLATIESRDTLVNYAVKAPVTGTVVVRGRSVGEPVSEESVLFEIADLSSVWVEIYIFPQYRHVAEKRQEVHLIAPDGDEIEALVDYVSPLIDPVKRTMKARCVLNGAGDDFSPGMFVRALIAVESVQATVRVEKDAVQMMNGETIVFIQDEHGTEPRDVQTGLSDGTYVEIKTGLEAGEKYVAHGAFAMKAELVTSGLDPHAGHGH